MITPKILAEMYNFYVRFNASLFFKINIVKPPVMGQISSYQYHIARLETLYTISDKLRSATLFKINELYFFVIMQSVIQIRNGNLAGNKRIYLVNRYF